MILIIQIGAILILSVVIALSPEVMSMILQSMNADPSGAFAFVDDDSYLQVVAEVYQKYAVLAQIIAMVIAMPLLLCLRGKKLFTHDLVAVNQKIKPLSIIKVLVLMMGMACVTTLIMLVFDLLGISLTEAMDDAFTNIFSNPLGLAYGMVIGPVFEEVIFRGAILNKLTRHGYNFAIVISALLFGLYHMILIQGFNAFILGILLAYVALRYSIKWSMVLHILYNSLLLGISSLDVVGISGEVAILVVYGLCFIGSIVLLLVKRKEFPPTIQAGSPQTPRPFRIAFTSPFLLIFMALLVLAGVFLLMIPVSL